MANQRLHLFWYNEGMVLAPTADGRRNRVAEAAVLRLLGEESHPDQKRGSLIAYKCDIETPESWDEHGAKAHSASNR